MVEEPFIRQCLPDFEHVGFTSQGLPFEDANDVCSENQSDIDVSSFSVDLDSRCSFVNSHDWQGSIWPDFNDGATTLTLEGSHSVEEQAPYLVEANNILRSG